MYAPAPPHTALTTLPLVALVLATSLASGCAHRVALSSNPAGATVSLAGTRVGITPMELYLPVVGPRLLRVELSGYRPLDVEVGFFPPLALELRMVPEHGAAGTWEPEDVR